MFYKKLFDNVDAYLDYFLSLEISNSKQKLFLAMFDTHGRKMLPLIYEQIQIVNIYIFWIRKENHQEGIKLFSITQDK